MTITPNELFIQNASCQKDLSQTAQLLADYCEQHDWVRPRTPEEILHSIHHWFLALKNNEIVGCFQKIPLDEEYTELGAFIVTKTRLGIGKILLEGFNHSCETEKAFAICNEDNPARSFFEKTIGNHSSYPSLLEKHTRDMTNRVLFEWRQEKK